MAEAGSTKVNGSNGVVKLYDVVPHTSANFFPGLVVKDGRISSVIRGSFNVTKGECIW
jgi:hypothetical protein